MSTKKKEQPDLSKEQTKLSKELTTLQYKFVINLFSGMTQRQAYINAGGKAKTQESQDSASSNMLSNVKVRSFYDSLMQDAQSSAVMTKQQALTRLTATASVTMKDVCDFKNVLVGNGEDGEPTY